MCVLRSFSGARIPREMGIAALALYSFLWVRLNRRFMSDAEHCFYAALKDYVNVEHVRVHIQTAVGGWELFFDLPKF